MRRFLNFFLASLAAGGWFLLYRQNVLGYSYTAFGPTANILQQFHQLKNWYLAAGGAVALWWLWELGRTVILPFMRKREASPAATAAGEDSKRLAQRG